MLSRSFNLTVKAFLLVIPFLYYAQVQLMRNDFVLIPYLLLSIFIVGRILYPTRKSEYSGEAGSTPGSRSDTHGRTKPFSVLEMLIFYFLIHNLLWVGFEIVYDIETNNADGLWPLRIMIYKVIPIFLYFFISRYSTKRDIYHFVLILCFASLVVAGEDMYERYHQLVLHQPAPFQWKNQEYVRDIGSGRTLSQLLLITYRAPGILEHLHATGTYIGLGSLAALTLFLITRKRLFLLILMASIAALAISGARTATIATIIAISFFGFAYRMYSGAFRDRGAFSMKSVVVAIIIVLFGTMLLMGNAEFFIQSLSGYYLENRSFYEVTSEEASGWIQLVSSYPVGLLFGFGGGTWRLDLRAVSDDFFVVDILGQYGVVGTVVFYLIAILFIVNSINWLRLYRLNKVRIEDGTDIYLLFAAAVVVLLMTTTLHSGAIVRKSIYPWLFVAYGIGHACWRSLLFQYSIQKSNSPESGDLRKKPQSVILSPRIQSKNV